MAFMTSLLVGIRRPEHGKACKNMMLLAISCYLELTVVRIHCIVCCMHVCAL